MLSSGMGKEMFFDSNDNTRTSIDSASSYFSADEDHDLDRRIFSPQSWTSDMMSVQERRKKFLCSMGFDKFISANSDFSQHPGMNLSDSLPEHIEPRLAETCAAALNPLSTADDFGDGNSFRCIKDLDNGNVFIVHEDGDDGLPSMLKELGSGKLLTFQEFEKLLGLSCSVHKPLQREVSPSGEEHCERLAARKVPRIWWRRLISKRPSAGMCSHDVSVKNSKISQIMRTKLLQNRKKCRELVALFIRQEIRAHEGLLIKTMKFSPSGWYLATGGEDYIVRVWQISEVDASCKSFMASSSTQLTDKAKSSTSFIGMKSDYSAPIEFPKKAFKITETPLQEFRGHTSEILDLSFSSSNCLLTSSMDKTVRMWKVGCDECLHVFWHIDYVTCIQFNPVDERYFISGSIDGKVRIWGISEHHVVDWVDIRDIVTAVCYSPDGQGVVVGSINGNCRFYDYLGNSMHLYFQFCIQGKQKLAAKRITGLQFSPDDTQKVLITSADSRVRIFDGFGVVHKYQGLRKTMKHLSASFTSNGRHIVSVGEDSNIYIWNYDFSTKPSAKVAKSIRTFELFFSKGVSVAVPWHDTDHKGLGSRTNALYLPSLPLKILEPSTWFTYSECLYLGSCLFAGGASRVGPEKLTTIAEAFSHEDNNHLGNHHMELNHQNKRKASLAAMFQHGDRNG